MGKGDRKSKKGKIFRKSFGNTRPKTEKVIQRKKENAEEKKKG